MLKQRLLIEPFTPGAKFFFVSIVFPPTSYEAHQPVGFELWVMSLELMQIHLLEHLVVLKHYKLNTGAAVFFTLHTC